MRLRAELITLLALAVSALPALGQAPGGPPSSGSRGLIVPATSAAATPVVLELFTSQGCSSCPAADKLLTTYAERPDLVALSLSVDYWDHLGWKDTLAIPKSSMRQKAYAKALGSGNVYTPQMVIGGAVETTGSNKVEIDKAIAARARSTGHPRLDAFVDGKRVTIVIGGASAAPGRSSTVWVAVVAPRVDVEIKRGENRGRVLSYHNVVREMTAVGMWEGQPLRIELPVNAVTESGPRCAVLLQTGEGGPIIAATWIGRH